MKIKRFDSSEGNVWKYVFDFGIGGGQLWYVQDWLQKKEQDEKEIKE
jgi:hypothetical protein